MIALGAIAPYIASMHAHLPVLLTVWSGRVVARFAAALFIAVVMATPVLAQEMPTGSRSGSLLNILLLAAIAFYLVRSFRKRGGDDGTRPGRWNHTETDDPSESDGDEPSQPMTIDRHEAARRTWDILSSDDKKRPEPKMPTAVSPGAGTAGFDEVEFLEGAKLFFARFQQARDAGDFQAIRDFISEEIFTEAMAAGDQGRIEVMLLTARLMELKSEEGRTVSTVFYDAQLRKGDQGERVEHVRQVWEFSRDDTAAGGLWVLERIDRVDQ